MDNNKHSLEWELIEMLKSIINKLIIAFIVLSLVLGTTIGIFIWYLNQYDYSSEVITTTIEADSDSKGDAYAVLNKEGQVMLNGKSNRQSCNEKQKED